jgi:hypothetical protein
MLRVETTVKSPEPRHGGFGPPNALDGAAAADAQDAPHTQDAQDTIGAEEAAAAGKTIDHALPKMRAATKTSAPPPTTCTIESHQLVPK